MTPLQALAARIQSVTRGEAEREELGVQVNEALDIASYITDDGDPCLSIDGAVAIVPPDHAWTIWQDGTAGCEPLPANDGMADGNVRAATPALALCAAAVLAWDSLKATAA